MQDDHCCLQPQRSSWHELRHCDYDHGMNCNTMTMAWTAILAIPLRNPGPQACRWSPSVWRPTAALLQRTRRTLVARGSFDWGSGHLGMKYDTMAWSMTPWHKVWHHGMKYDTMAWSVTPLELHANWMMIWMTRSTALLAAAAWSEQWLNKKNDIISVTVMLSAILEV